MLSSTTQYSAEQIDALRQIGRDKGLDSATVEAKLQQAGVIQSPDQAGGGSLMRVAGLAGRAVVEAFGGMNPIDPAKFAALGGNPPPTQSPADKLGLPTPATPGERMAVAGGEGAIIGGMTGGTGGIAALGGASSLAGQGAAEAGASPMGQMAAQMVVGMGFPVVGTLLSGGIRAALAGSAARRAAAQQSAAILQAAAPEAPMTLGQVAQGGLFGGGRTIEGGLKNIPGAGGVLKGAWDQQAAAMGKKMSGIADQAGASLTPAAAGAAMQRGIEEGFIPQFEAESARRYNQFFELVDPKMPVSPGKSAELFANQNSLAADARELSDDITNPFVAGILKHMDQAAASSPDGTIPLNVMKELRSRLGAVLSGAEIIPNINMRDVDRLYGALSSDMRSAIETQGNPGALQAWDNASNFWKQGKDHIQTFLQPLLNKQTPELAFRAAMSGTKDGATLLDATMKSLPKGESDLVMSTVLKRLGQAAPDAGEEMGATFNPQLYLRQWRTMSGDAKTALLRSAPPGMRADLDNLAKAAAIRESSAKVLYNPSGTASNNVFATLLTSAGLFAGGAVQGNATMMAAGAAPWVGMGSANVVAKMFTNPKMIQWLTKQTRVPIGAIGAQLAILKHRSEKWDPESREIAQGLGDMLDGVDWAKILMSTGIANHMTPSQ